MDLNRVVTFVHVVEAGGFTAAASRLRLPPSSVSRGVAKLERELGVVLLERTTRRVALTDAGRAYYERAREALAGLDQAALLAGDAEREPSGVVRLAAPPELTGKIVGTLGAFVRRHPRVRVDVTATARGAELVGGAVDLAIVLGRLDDSSLFVRRLGATRHRLYAAAPYLERRGRPRSVADLACHDAVLYRAGGGRATWELVGPRGPEAVEVSGPMGGDSLGFVVDAVAAGCGVGLLPEPFFGRASASAAALVPVLPKFTAVGAPQSIVYPARHLPKRVALLRDALAEHLTSPCAASGGA